jgi:DNA repair exonuclease SbcCD ATPase subunit
MVKRVVVAILAVSTLAACDRSKEQLQQKVAELQTVSAQKDSLIQEVMSTTQFVSDLSTDLAAVKALNSGKPVASEASELAGKTPAQMRATVRERVKDLAKRLDESESRLSQSRARVQSLSGSNTDMQKQLAVYDSTISSLQAVIESQKTEVASLSDQVLGLQKTNATLAATRDTLTTQRDQLTGTVSTMTMEGNKAYYIIGTKKDLLAKGILSKTGGFLGLGKSIVPSRSLSEQDFTQIDRMKDSTIAFPSAEKKYEIVSRQDPKFLATAPDKNHELGQSLKVASPEQFWASSKFLIVVEK